MKAATVPAVSSGSTVPSREGSASPELAEFKLAIQDLAQRTGAEEFLVIPKPSGKPLEGGAASLEALQQEAILNNALSLLTIARVPQATVRLAAFQSLEEEYGFKMTPTKESHFECGELSFKPKYPGELRRTVAEKLNAELKRRGIDYGIFGWLLERPEMNKPFGKEVVRGLVGKDSNGGQEHPEGLYCDQQKRQMPPGNDFTNRAEWAILLAFHRLATKGEDHSLENLENLDLGFRTEPGIVWSGPRGVGGSDGDDGYRLRSLFAVRSESPKS